MAKLKGITVILVSTEITGYDPFGAPITTERETEVENVLVAPTSADDIVNQLNLHGKKAVYTLGIPKGDTNVWEGKKVRFFGQTWRVFGKPLQGIDGIIPLEWNKKVTVEAYE